MPIGHKKLSGKRSHRYISQGEKAIAEGFAIVRALAFRPLKKSKAQVKRKAKGWNYNFRGLSAEERRDRVRLVKIAPFERWQFGSDAPDLSGITDKGDALFIPDRAKMPKIAQDKNALRSKENIQKKLRQIATLRGKKLSAKETLDNFLDEVL